MCLPVVLYTSVMCSCYHRPCLWLFSLWTEVLHLVSRNSAFPPLLSPELLPPYPYAHPPQPIYLLLIFDYPVEVELYSISLCVCVLWLVYFAEHNNAFRIHPCCRICQNFLKTEYSIIYHILLIYSSVSRWFCSVLVLRWSLTMVTLAGLELTM